MENEEKVVTIHMVVGTTAKRKEAAVSVEKKEETKMKKMKCDFWYVVAGELRMKENRKRRKMCTLHNATQ